MQQGTHLVGVSSLFNRYQSLFGGHHRGDRSIHIRGETNIATGDNTDQVIFVEDGNTGDIIGFGKGMKISQSGCSLKSEGVFNHTTFIFFNCPDLFGLLLDGHALVDNADTAFLGKGNGQTRLGHSIHGRGNQRDIHGNTAGQLGRCIYIFGCNLRVAGY